MAKGNHISNYPNATVERLNGTEFCTETVNSIAELSKQGKPQTTEELQERIDSFFRFCAESSMKPGVETLSLALSIDRVTFWSWCQDSCGKGAEWIAIYSGKVHQN